MEPSSNTGRNVSQEAQMLHDCGLFTVLGDPAQAISVPVPNSTEERPDDPSLHPTVSPRDLCLAN